MFRFRLSAAIMRVQAFSRQFSNLLKETGKRIHCLSIQHNRNHALFTKLEEQNRAVASSVKQYGMEREREIDRIKKEFQDVSMMNRIMDVNIFTQHLTVLLCASS